MNEEKHRLRDYLAHILEAIARILAYSAAIDKRAFLESQIVQDAVIRNFEVIGEASNSVQKRFPKFAAQHPELPLALAYQMRNAVAHGYFEVDLEIVWTTIQTDLPAFLIQVQQALESITHAESEPMRPAG
ncbi:MAG: DUF86 domain-containing protein [Betaproteobacteria bacterium]|nr:DUF86 domain-containing protein [Betaproteobacteria bacterium]